MEIYKKQGKANFPHLHLFLPISATCYISIMKFTLLASLLATLLLLSAVTVSKAKENGAFLNKRDCSPLLQNCQNDEQCCSSLCVAGLCI
jgi:uncharacterized membrane protein